MPYVINPETFDQALQEIKKNPDAKLFDFSRTDFAALGSKKIMQLFSVLSNRSQTFALKLNDCVFAIGNNSNDNRHIQAITLGLATTKLIESIEIKRSIITPQILVSIAVSLLRNYALKNIHVDGCKETLDSGVKVIPYHVRDLLRSHNTAVHVIVDGLRNLLFAGKQNHAANSPVHQDDRKFNFKK